MVRYAKFRDDRPIRSRVILGEPEEGCNKAPVPVSVNGRVMSVTGTGRARLCEHVKGTNPPFKKSSNIPEICAKMLGRFH